MSFVPLPQGVVTFLLTDIEGSTAAWESRTQSMIEASRLHDEWGEEVIGRHNGHLLKKKFAGDALFGVFQSPADALRAVTELQCKYQSANWPGGAKIKVRMGLHVGESADTRNEDYYGPVVNRCARIQGVAHGGQILISEEVKSLAEDQVRPEIWFQDLGEHRLKDLSLPVRLYQVCAQGIAEDFPPVNSLSGFKNNLPTQTASFVGRQRELSEIQELLRTRAVVVLLGPGGIGKTRLALQSAAELIERFPHGTWFIPLDQIMDGTPVVRAVADKIGVQENPGQSVKQAVLDYLKEREVLLVLDNSEHLVSEVTALISEIASSCPKVRILATTRERLRVQGAATYDLDPLPLADEETDAESLSQSPAIRLFLDRAASETRRFQVDEESIRLVAKLCAMLDGVPYMIELAAARARSVPLETMLERIDDRFRVLGRGDPTRVPRQQSLRALIDWSYDLLDPDQKTVFRRLAAFVGGWNLESAEAVVSAEPIDAFDVIDLLSSLVDKSLVAFDLAGKRYRMLETVRKYVSELHVASPDHDEIEARHRNHFLNFIEGVGGSMGKAEEVALHSACDEDLENLRKVLRTAGKEAPTVAAKAWTQLFRYMDARARFSEPREALEALCNSTEVAADGKLLTIVCQTLGNLSRRQGDLEKALAWFERALALARERNEPSAIGAILSNMATISLFMSKFHEAENQATEGCRLAESTSNWRAAVTCRLVLTNVYSSTDQLKLAQSELENAKQVVEAQGFHDLVPYVENNLALNLIKQGDCLGALALLSRRAQALLQEGNRTTLLEVFRFAAEALLGTERLDDSAALYELERRLRESYQITLAEGDERDRSAHIDHLIQSLGDGYSYAAARWAAIKSDQELHRAATEFLQQFSAAAPH